jgi:hypothetical protein
MCEIVTGKAYEIKVPRLAYKVLRRSGGILTGGILLTGPYYAPSRDASRSGWESMKVYRASPAAGHNPALGRLGVTGGGIHVFWTTDSALRWQRNHFMPGLVLLPVLVWGTALPYENGAAVEFATLARPCELEVTG